MRPSRAFALPIVFLVLLLIGLAFVGMSDTMVVAAQAAGRRVKAQEKFYACEGVVRMAQGLVAEMSLDDPDIELFDLSAALEPVRAVAIENGIDLSAPSRAPEETAIIDEGALEGLEVMASVGSFGVSSPAAVGCNFNISQPIGKISPLQFLAFSIEGGEIENGTNVTVADPDFTWGRVEISAPPPVRDDVTETDVNSAPLRLPLPAEGEARGAGLARARTFLPYIKPPFTNNAALVAERASARFAYQADIRIIDGEWYLRDPANVTAWPGIPVWGDHPCDNDNAPSRLCAATFTNTSSTAYTNEVFVRRQYSAYERFKDGILDDTPFNGVVSYGLLAGTEPGTIAGRATCGGSGLVAARTCAPSPRAGLIDAARATFDDDGRAMLPINIDVSRLAQALGTVSPANDEIGNHVCFLGAPGCTREFNGMVYITSTKGLAPTATIGALPYALCGGSGSIDNGTSSGQTQSCDTALRYNAVRLHNASNLTPFASTGLTIATDLPAYVSGDWNRVFVPGMQRTLVMADRVTLLTSSWRDDLSGASNGDIDFNGSVITGWSAGSGARRFSDLLRTIESNVSTRVIGSLVGGFSSTVPAGRSGRTISSWTHPASLTRPTNDAQPPGVPRVALGLPSELSPSFSGSGGCGGG